MFKIIPLEDLDRVVEIREALRPVMKTSAPVQWTGEYPGRSDFETDIKNNWLIGYYEDGKLLGYLAMVNQKEEPFTEGMWNDKDYVVLHRVATDPKELGKSIATKLLKYAMKLSMEQGYEACWIDTHDYNIPMKKAIEKAGFKFDGIFYKNGTDKLAERFRYLYTDKK